MHICVMITVIIVIMETALLPLMLLLLLIIISIADARAPLLYKHFYLVRVCFTLFSVVVVHCTHQN